MTGFLSLSALILLTIVVSAVVFWRLAPARWMQSDLGAVEAEEYHRTGARTARTALVFSSMVALLLFLLTGAPWMSLYQAGANPDDSTLRTNIAVLKRLINTRYADVEDQKTANFARAQFQLAEHFTVAGEYLQASDRLHRLHQLWPDDVDFQRHYCASLAFASLQASAQNHPEKAKMLREKIRRFVTRYPRQRQTVRDIFALYLQAQSPPATPPSPATTPAPMKPGSTAAGEGADSITLHIQYPEAKRIAAGAIMFVSAHPVGQTKGTMPVAAKKFDQPPFPASVYLNSQDELQASVGLNDYKELEIVARISQFGTIKRHKSDMIGHVVVKTGSPRQAWSIRIMDSPENSDKPGL
ncbi:MAG: hypothetical protein K0U66_01845 [Gammaproteobacteria bacterium]|nr:hypothetical protein [Gammaproteobacteria bacterium]